MSKRNGAAVIPRLFSLFMLTNYTVDCVKYTLPGAKLSFPSLADREDNDVSYLYIPSN